jgi:hypothetical protein
MSLAGGSAADCSPVRPARAAPEASLFGRASPSALRTGLGDPDWLEVAEPEAEPNFLWDGSGPVRLTLPLDWVMTVWGRDLSVVAEPPS